MNVFMKGQNEIVYQEQDFTKSVFAKILSLFHVKFKQ